MEKPNSRSREWSLRSWQSSMWYWTRKGMMDVWVSAAFFFLKSHTNNGLIDIEIEQGPDCTEIRKERRGNGKRCRIIWWNKGRRDIDNRNKPNESENGNDNDNLNAVRLQQRPDMRRQRTGVGWMRWWCWRWCRCKYWSVSFFFLSFVLSFLLSKKRKVSLTFSSISLAPWQIRTGQRGADSKRRSRGKTPTWDL